MVRHFGFLGDFDGEKNRDAEPKPTGASYLFSFTKKIIVANRIGEGTRILFKKVPLQY